MMRSGPPRDRGRSFPAWHIFLRLPHLPVDATGRLLDVARAHGVHVYSGRPYYHLAPRDVTLILGYTTVAPEDIDRGVERLAAAYRSAPSRWGHTFDLRFTKKKPKV